MEDVSFDPDPGLTGSSADCQAEAAARLAIKILSKNPKGFFLMIEKDTHTDNPKKGLENMVAFDKLIREILTLVDPKETLLLFTADHSFDFRLVGAGPDDPMLKGLDEWEAQSADVRKQGLRIPSMRMNNSHTGEEVLVAATGPGSEQVHGYMPNTKLFEIMLNAWGWPKK